jgi:hypothetical protein
MRLNPSLKVLITEEIAGDRDGVDLFSNDVVDMKRHVWRVMHTDTEVKDDRAEEHGKY